MDGKEIQARLMVQFDLIFRERGRGTQISLTRAMGVQDNYFARVRNGDLRFTWDRLGQALEILEIEPFEFFARALQPTWVSDSRLELFLNGPLKVNDRYRRAILEVENALKQRTATEGE